MSDRVFYCPGCRQHFPDSRLPPRGQLFDCPRCQLLFLPADKDFAGGVGRGEYEATWADEGVGRGAKPPQWTVIRRRRLRIWTRDLIWMWCTGFGMLAIAGIIFLMARSAHDFPKSGGDGRTAISPKEKSGERQPSANTTSPRAATSDPVANSDSMRTVAVAQGRESALVGDWEAEQPIETADGAEVVALTLGPKSEATVEARSGLDVETLTGRWTLAGSSLTLHVGDSSRQRTINATLEWLDGNRIRLLLDDQKTAVFRRK